jgi:hypothetical protein
VSTGSAQLPIRSVSVAVAAVLLTAAAATSAVDLRASILFAAVLLGWTQLVGL